VRICSRGEGMSIINWSLDMDMEKCRPPAEAELGEASGEEFDIAFTVRPEGFYHRSPSIR
jgi:hypothetical protein